MPGYEEYSDFDLVDACLSGDKLAWRVLVEKYAGLIYSIPRKLQLSSEDCDDIFQEVCILWYRNLDKIRAIQAMPAWLATSTRRLTWRKLRDYSKLEELDVDTLIFEENSSSQDVEWKKAVLINAFKVLNERCQKILYKLYLKEEPESYKELAEELGVPINSLSPWRMRCLDQLKKELTKKGFSNEDY